MGITGNGLILQGGGFIASYIPTPPVPSIVTAGLQLYLDAGNPASYPGSGTSWTDTIGGKVFTLNNGPTYNAANGGYLNFVAASSQYGIASSLPAALTRYTAEVWHYWTGVVVGAAPIVFGEWRSGAFANFIIGSLGTYSGKINGGYWASNTWQQGSANFYTPVVNSWNQFVTTYDGANIKLYVNTGLTFNQPPVNNSTPGSSGLGLMLMKRGDNTNYQGGGLSIVRVYNTALTQAQVTQNYNIDKGRYGLA